MIQTPKRLLLENRAWAREAAARDRAFFADLCVAQRPDVLWIGCSDSRVPAESITNSAPGELFVHRNIANLIADDDCNTASVIEYAVRMLHVKHVIVCGHYGCGGVRAALLPEQTDTPAVNRRIAPLRRLAAAHRDALQALPTLDARVNRLAELNVMRQIDRLRETPTLHAPDRDAPPPSLHGWIYGLHDGLLHELATFAAPLPA